MSVAGGTDCGGEEEWGVEGANICVPTARDVPRHVGNVAFRVDDLLGESRSTIAGILSYQAGMRFQI